MLLAWVALTTFIITPITPRLRTSIQKKKKKSRKVQRGLIRVGNIVSQPYCPSGAWYLLAPDA